MKIELLNAITAINYAETQMSEDGDLVLADTFALEAIAYINKYREWLSFKKAVEQTD